jgi:predicted nuclease of predicted toxin-antitoxin system
VKILNDAQLPPGLKPLLTQTGHEAYHVAEVGLRDAGDAQLWGYAVREQMVILTKDEDFAARRLREPHGPIVV